MKEPIDAQRVSAFLDGLWQASPSLAQRVVAAYFIRTYRGEIESYIEQQITTSGSRLSTIVWARKTRKLLAKYRKGVPGHAYNPRYGTLENLYLPRIQPFRLTGHPRHSLTFPSHHPAVAVAGYVAAAGCIAGILWLGWRLKLALDAAGEDWMLPVLRLLEE